MALDLGEQWIGVALSDSSQLFSKPYKTVPINELEQFLKTILATEPIDKIIIGYPKTMRGTESLQTKKIVAQKEELERLFPQNQFVLWDERLSSQRAESIKKSKTKEDKIRSHAVAAAFILESYLLFLHPQNFQ